MPQSRDHRFFSVAPLDLVVSVHAVARVQLGLLPTPLDVVFIAAFIYGGPLLAMALLWRGRGRTRPALAVLSLSMLGALAFATHHHFIAISPDHVDHLPAGPGRSAFRVTAYLAEPIAALGVVLGVVGLVVQRAGERPPVADS